MVCKKCKDKHKGDIYEYCFCDCHKVVYMQKKDGTEVKND